MSRSRSRPSPLATLAPLREAAALRWGALAARERIGLALAGGALALLLLWSLAIRPAWQVLREAPAQRAALEAQLARMRSLATEARELRAQPPVTPEQSGAALEAATARLGEKARLNRVGDQATVTLTALEPLALLDWLGEVRGAARARVVEAQLTRSGSGYSGSVVLALPRAL